LAGNTRALPGLLQQPLLAAPLKKLIESYNATPKAQRQAVLDHMMANPKTREHVRELLAEQRQQEQAKAQKIERDNSPGMSL